LSESALRHRFYTPLGVEEEIRDETEMADVYAERFFSFA
jgi:hypothetical protein